MFKKIWGSRLGRRFVIGAILVQCLCGAAFQAQCTAWVLPVQFHRAPDPKSYYESVEFPNGKSIRIHVIGGIWTGDALMQSGVLMTRQLLRGCIVPDEGEAWALMDAYRPETFGFIADGTKALKGLAGSRFGMFQTADLAIARELRRRVDADLALGHEVIVIGNSYGAFLAALALGDGPQGVGLLTLGSPVEVSGLGIPHRDVCVGGDQVCALRGPIASSFGFGPKTPGVKRLFSQHFPDSYLVRSQGSVMRAFTELCAEMGYLVKTGAPRA